MCECVTRSTSQHLEHVLRGFVFLDADNLACFCFIFTLMIPRGHIYLTPYLLNRKVKPQGEPHNCNTNAPLELWTGRLHWN